MVTIIIPTYNRKEVLVRVLDALARQTAPADSFEVIVVDDGSSDGTFDIVSKRSNLSEGHVRYLYQKNKGPAAARNLGIKEANFPIVLFINDDTIPADDFIEQHLSFHEKWKDDCVAVVGYAAWAEGIQVPIYASHYLVAEFKKLEGLREVRPVDFITCNLSVKKSFLLNNGLFDEGFPYAAHEDRELGHRLGKKGLRIMYNPSAVVYHYHIFDNPKPFIQHNKHLGAALAIWESRVPNERKVLIEFGLRDYSSLVNIARETGRELLFNSAAVPFWLWVISRIGSREYLTYYLYSHLIAQSQKEGYRRQKSILRNSARTS